MESASTQAFSFVTKFNEIILFPTIGLLSAAALLLFIYGCFTYIVNAADPSARQQGVRHITWGIIGLVVMLSAYAIMMLFANSLGLGGELEGANQGDVVVPSQFGGPTGGNSGGPTGGNQQ